MTVLAKTALLPPLRAFIVACYYCNITCSVTGYPLLWLWESENMKPTSFCFQFFFCKNEGILDGWKLNCSIVASCFDQLANRFSFSLLQFLCQA